MTLAIHTNNSAPKDVKIYIPKTYEFLSTMLSALSWRKHNGEIKLYTDQKVYEFYARNNLLDIWNQINISNFNSLENINHKVFWASSKFHAIKNETPPFFVMDTDFIVWNPIEPNLLEEKVMAIHKENIDNKIYPSKENLKLTDKQLSKVERLNWEKKPTNTAFTYFNDTEFKNKYINMVLDFIKHHDSKNNDNLIYMVFVEQRLFSMVADSLNINIKYLLNDNTIFNQNNYTHLWGLKNKLKNEPFSKMHFNSMCINRITRDYSEYLEKEQKTIKTLEGARK